MKIELSDAEVRQFLEDRVRTVLNLGPEIKVEAEGKSYHGIDAFVHIIRNSDKPAQEDGE
jgi:hypothetical protein